MIIKYNKKYNRYILPLGLWFDISNSHIEYPNHWICKSNIPEIHFMQVTDATVSKEQAVKLVIDLILERLDLKVIEITYEDFEK